MTVPPPTPPLAGVGVAVTRAEEPNGPLARRLARAGARVQRWQALEIVPAADPGPLAKAVASLASYDWIVFASAHAVAAVAAAPGARPSAAPPVAAVGRETARAAEQAGFTVRRVPGGSEGFGATGLLASLRASGEMAGARVLLPASSIARSELAAGLADLGASVDQLTAYRTRSAALDAARCRAELAAGEVSVVTFTSPSAVESVAAAFGPADLARALRSILVVSIGPTTSGALRELGLEPSAEAAPCTLDGVVAAAIAAVALRNRSGPSLETPPAPA